MLGNLHARVHRRGQHPPKGLGTNKTVEATKHPRKHKMHPHQVKKEEEKIQFRLDSNDFGFICAGISNMVSSKRNIRQYNLSCLLQIYV